MPVVCGHGTTGISKIHNVLLDNKQTSLSANYITIQCPSDCNTICASSMMSRMPHPVTSPFSTHAMTSLVLLSWMMSMVTTHMMTSLVTACPVMQLPTCTNQWCHCPCAIHFLPSRYELEFKLAVYGFVRTRHFLLFSGCSGDLYWPVSRQTAGCSEVVPPPFTVGLIIHWMSQ